MEKASKAKKLGVGKLEGKPILISNFSVNFFLGRYR